ncbi:MAG: hypothetical protein QOI95_779 [Acidimicrobiaceae bacterium]|jgi:predicted ATPase/DNA-binding SARP family transcriptional activator
MQVRLLGGLDVVDDQGEDVDVAGTKLRSLLVVLSLSVGRVVPSEQIVDALWGEDPPPGVRNGLQGLVSKLRKALGDPSLVVSRGAGYALDLPPEAVDVHRFERLSEDGRAAASSGDHERALELLLDADTLWRGDALAEFAYEEFARPAITRLSELRFAAVEERMSSELALGRHSGVIPALEALVNEHPLREQLRGQLMVALYRAGRQADALRVFQQGRQILGEELGLDPGPELRRLEAAVLSQDPTLDAPSVAAGPSSSRSGGAEHQWHLPSSLTPLVGREHELRELTALFAEHRLITLVGPGGVGKTRLALDVAHAERAALTNGALLIELAPVGDPASVRSAIAAALEVADPDRTAELIGDRELLIVVDNCEHVIDAAAAAIEDLLQQCPRLHVLATSREPLRINGETVWSVPPLASDDAAQLFVQRAHAAGAQFLVSDELRPLITEICTRLDGLPLAIELAAARTRAFPLQQLAERLDDRFRLLTGGSRTALPRQQALRAVVDWSYDLLFEDQRRVFERLSAFPGGCTLGTAEAVCADDEIPAEDMEDIIEALVDKSLVIAQRSDDDIRFVQLQTLAHYGREKLVERGDATRIRERMAAYYAAHCENSLDAFAGNRQREWLAVVVADHDNFRAAMEWAIDAENAEAALRIAGALGWLHWLTGMGLEGKRWLDDAFRAAGDTTPGTRALALFSRGFLNFLAGEPEHTNADLEEAIALFREIGDLRALAIVLGFYSEVSFACGDIVASRRLREEAGATHGVLPDEPFNVASRAYSRGKVALTNDDFALAEMHYREAASQYAEGENLVMLSICLDWLAAFDARCGNLVRATDELVQAVELNQALGLTGYLGVLLARLGIMRTSIGDFEGAQDANARAVELGRRLMDAPVLGMALSSQARLLLRLRRFDEAAEVATEALGVYQAAGSGASGSRRNLQFDVQAGTAMAYAVLGFVAQHNGDGVEADRLHRAGLGQAQLTRNPRAIAVALEGLAGAAVATGDGKLSAELLGHAAQLRAAAGVALGDFEAQEIERVQDAAMALLGLDGFAAAFEQGHHSELIDLVG